jgi:hypothetical protein
VPILDEGVDVFATAAAAAEEMPGEEEREIM